MYRRFGMLAALAFLFVLVCGVITPTAFASSDLNDETAVTTMGDENGDEGKKEEPKKERKYPPYHYKLQSKLKEPGPPPEKPKYKPWGKVITPDHQLHEGLIPIYTNQEDVIFVLSEENLDVPMLAIMSISQGIGSNFVYGGLPIDNVMFDFHREEDHLQIRRLTTQFRAPGDEALEEAIALTFSNSILASLPIASEKGGKIAVEMNKFYLSDVSGMSIWLGAVLSQPVRLDRERNWFNSIKNYPENTEIDTRLTYSPGRVQGLDLPNVPDPRYIQIGVSYSIRKLPEDPMTPRIADPRVGYFTTTHKDFTRQKDETFFVHYANRWRLEKKDPDAAMSEPVEPIVFYMDTTIPEEYVQYIMDGVEFWQRSFEAAGFKNAIIAKRAPTPEEDPDYDPVDARYNTIRWNVSDQVMYGAIGPSRVDPRTGEIIDADILFEHNMVMNFGKTFRRYAAPRTALMELDPVLKELWMTDEEKANEVNLNDVPQLRDKGHMFCNLTDGMMLSGQFQAIVMMARGYIDPDGEMPEEFVGDALRFVAAHEVGHTLGLRHNFASSGSTPYESLNDKAKIKEIGMTGSVMDYSAPNIAYNASEQGYYWAPGCGTYDDWAITWGYGVVDGDDEWAQSKALEGIAAQSTDKAHLYETDEDTYPMHAMDPRSNIWDLSDDPMAWGKERIAICDDLLRDGNLEDRLIEDGGSYVQLRNAVVTLLMQRYVASNIAIKNVGGQYNWRVRKGADKLPLEPVPAAEQQAALNWVVDNAIKSDSYVLPPAMLNKLQDDRMWSWQNNLFQPGRRYDFPLSGWVMGIQNATLSKLMNPMLQARVEEAQYKVDKPFKLSQLYNALTRAIWTEDPIPSGRTAAWDRNLQRLYTQKLIWQVTIPMQGLPQDAVALSRLNLRRIRSTAEGALARQGLDDETNAHLMETIARIDRALDAKRVTPF